MKTKYLITTTFLLLGFIQNVFSQTYLDSQKQNNEYKSLHDATTRAYATPDSSNSSQSNSNSGSSTSNSSSNPYSNSGSSVTDYNFNTAPRLNLNSYESRQAKIQKDHAKQQAIYDAFDVKEKKWKTAMAAYGIQKTGENFNKFVELGVQCGLERATCLRMLGYSAEGYQEIIDSEDGRVASLAGSTKDNCQGDCTETLSYADGTIYVGNSKHGYPEGNGTVTTNGITYSGNFHRGVLDGFIKMESKNDKVIRYATYKNNDPADGPYKYVYVTHEQTGFIKNNKAEAMVTLTYSNGNVETINRDTNFSTYTYADGTKYEGERKNKSLFTGKYIYINGIIFEGVSNDKGEHVKGKITYTNDSNFTGEFKNDKQYRGKMVGLTTIVSGEFYETGKTLKVGSYENIANKSIEYVSLDSASKRNGYCKAVYANGMSFEDVYKDDKITGFNTILFSNGSYFVGQINTVPGYFNYGINKGTDGSLTPYAKKTQNDKWEKLPDSEIVNAKFIYKNATAEIAKAKAVYIAATSWSTEFNVN